MPKTRIPRRFDAPGAPAHQFVCEFARCLQPAAAKPRIQRQGRHGDRRPVVGAAHPTRRWASSTVAAARANRSFSSARSLARKAPSRASGHLFLRQLRHAVPELDPRPRSRAHGGCEYGHGRMLSHPELRQNGLGKRRRPGPWAVSAQSARSGPPRAMSDARHASIRLLVVLSFGHPRADEMGDDLSVAR
jgi:hypothetical protein